MNFLSVVPTRKTRPPCLFLCVSTSQSVRKVASLCATNATQASRELKGSVSHAVNIVCYGATHPYEIIPAIGPPRGRTLPWSEFFCYGTI